MKTGPRIAREKKTITAMLAIFCQDNHGSARGSLCSDCTTLRDYAINRLKQCPYQELKPTCGTCTTHCYKTTMQKQVKEVMRFSGSRMIFRHPLLAFFHLFDGYRKRQ